MILKQLHDKKNRERLKLSIRNYPLPELRNSRFISDLHFLSSKCSLRELTDGEAEPTSFPSSKPELEPGENFAIPIQSNLKAVHYNSISLVILQLTPNPALDSIPKSVSES